MAALAIAYNLIAAVGIAATSAITFGAVAIGSTAVGFIAGVTAIVAGATIANKLISNLYEMPKMDTDSSRQRTVRSTIEPQKIIYGEALVSGPISFVGVYGSKNRVMAHAVVLAGHEVEAITDIHFDNEVISSSNINSSGFVTSGIFGPTGGNQFTEAGINFGYNICKINKHLGAPGQAADADLVSAFGSYTTNHKGTGLAYISTHWLMKDDSQATWDKYTPQAIKALVKGRKVYDPRTSTTAYSDNPALCLADYLTNTTFGMSISSSRIDWDSVEAAANACDALVTGAYSTPGGDQKRFTCNGVLFATDSHKTNINKILSAMNGMLTYTNGRFVIRAGDYEAPTVFLNEDSLMGAVSVKTSVERSDRFNTVTGTFIDPTQNHKATEFPEVYLASARSRDNGEILTKQVQLPMTNDRYMAQRIAHKLIQQSDQQKVVTFPVNLKGMEVAVGDRVSISLEEFNWSNKVFMCLGWTLSDSGNGGINLTLREDDSGSYADPATGEYSTITSTGAIVEGFRGVADPQNLQATAGLKNITLNWDNPENMDGILYIEVFASPDSSWANRVLLGTVNGTQFIHDSTTVADPVQVNDQRWYWIRARAYTTGEDATAVSDRNPDNDTSNISATVGVIPWADVAGDDKPEDNATVGATIGTDLKDESFTVVGGADVLNQHDFFLITTDNNQAPSGAAFSAVAGRNPREGDTVITRDTSGTIDVTYAWQYSGSAWTQISTFISGDLLVDGSITANELAADSVTADKIDVSQLSAISADMGALTAGSITLGDTPPTAGSAPAPDESGAAIDNDGKITLGNETNYVAFDGSTVTIRGDLNADDITAGELSVDRLSVKDFNNLVKDSFFASSSDWEISPSTDTSTIEFVSDATYGTALKIVGDATVTTVIQSEARPTPVSHGQFTIVAFVRSDAAGVTSGLLAGFEIGFEAYSGSTFVKKLNIVTNMASADENWVKVVAGKSFAITDNITHIIPYVKVYPELTAGNVFISKFTIANEFRGEAIADNSIDPDAIDAEKLSDIRTNLGHITSGSMSIGGATFTLGTDGVLGNLTTTGFLRGPETFYIDPAAHGDATGSVVIRGNLQVDGTTTTINSTTLNVDDINITVAKGAANAAAADGGGITIDGADVVFAYDATDVLMNLNSNFQIESTPQYFAGTGAVGLGELKFKDTGINQSISIIHNPYDSDIPSPGTALIIDRFGAGTGDAHLVVHGEIYAKHQGTPVNGKKVWHAGDFTSTSVSNWNSAYGWGDHSSAGYLTSVALDDLTDVTVGTPTDGQALVYNNTTSQWEPATISINGGNAATLDGLDSTQFLRSDANDSTTGSLSIGGNLTVTGSITMGNTVTAPVISSTTAIGETIEIVFNESVTDGVEAYEVYSSVGGGSYGLIARLSPEDFAATMTVVDSTFLQTGVTIAYRVYALKYGIYSSPSTSTITYTTPSLDVTNMSVVPSNTDYDIQYNLPNSRFVDHIEIYMDAETLQGSLSRTGATLIYSGLNTSYTYPIGSADMDKYHQFWVEVVSS